MSISNFIPEVWHATLLSALRKELVFAQGGVVNRDYEGDISQYGDTVHIPSISDPTVGTYTKDTDITTQALTDADLTLVIDQSKYFSFEVDDLDDRQVRNGGNLMAEAASRSAYLLAEVADEYLAGVMKAGVDAGNLLSAHTSAAAAADIDTALITFMKVLDQQNVPRSGRWCVTSPAGNALLLGNTKFVQVNQAGTSEGLRNGIVGRAYGFDILMSNNLPTGTTYPVMIAGHPMACSYAEQISKVEAFRLEKRFADGLKGLHLYGSKVVRPKALVAQEINGL